MALEADLAPSAAAVLPVAAVDAAMAGLRRASDFFTRRMAPADQRCPRHGVAHTGKLARSIVIDLALFRATGEQRYWQRSTDRARVTIQKQAQDPEHGGWVFLPGRFDPRNCSTSAIDTGECTDALARLALAGGESLPPDERTSVADAVVKSAASYLVAAAVEKDCPNQRLWAGMGLASAYGLEGNPGWRDALVRCLERSAAEQRADGSWPYHPYPDRGGLHKGAADVSTYYQSRCIAFTLRILDCLAAHDSHPPDHDAVLERGLEFLAAAYQGDGVKCLGLEGKRWFWTAPYEVGSHPYDVYALVRGGQLFDRADWLELAGRALRQLLAHQNPDGSVAHTHAPHPEDDFVCPDFHTADLAWLALALDEGASRTGRSRGTRGNPPNSPSFFTSARGYGPIRHFPDSGLIRYDSPQLIAIWRASKTPHNTLYGGGVAGGSLLYVGRPADGWRNVLSIDRDAARVQANLSLYPGRASVAAGLRRFFAENRLPRDLRQWAFVVRLLLYNRHVAAAVRRLWRGLARPLLESLALPATTHWACAAQVELLADSVRFRLAPSTPDGKALAGVEVVRFYQLAEQSVEVSEELRTAVSLRRGVYSFPPTADAVRVEASCPHRLRRDTLLFGPLEASAARQGHLVVRYRL